MLGSGPEAVLKIITSVINCSGAGVVEFTMVSIGSRLVKCMSVCVHVCACVHTYIHTYMYVRTSNRK